MTINRYAFLVENEIFEIVFVDTVEAKDIEDAWSKAFASGISGMQVINDNDAVAGAIWNGTSFDSSAVSEDIKAVTYPEWSRGYLYMSDNKILARFNEVNMDDFRKNMYAAAFATNSISGINISSYPEEVSYGWTWNGSSFDAPKDQ
jgi:hypothetical protein